MAEYIMVICIAQVMGSWPMWGGELAHKSVQLMKGAMTTTPVIKWRFATGGALERQFSAVADADGDGSLEVVIGSFDGKVYCLNGATGSQEWAYLTGSRVRTPGSLVDIDGDNRLEFLVPSGDDDTLRCLNAEDGSLLWQITLANDISSPFVGDIDGDGCSEIMVGTGGFSIFAVDDAGGASDCGFLYYDVKEGSGSGAMEFRPLGQGLYLFVPNETQVSLSLYDASGRLIQNLYDGLLRPGGHTFIPNSETKGVYLAVLRYSGGMKTLKVVK